MFQFRKTALVILTDVYRLFILTQHYKCCRPSQRYYLPTLPLLWLVKHQDHVLLLQRIAERECHFSLRQRLPPSLYDHRRFYLWLQIVWQGKLER